MRITNSVNIPVLVVRCCQTMNYALLKFLDVNRVNGFAIYLYTVEAISISAFLSSEIKIKENNNWHNFRNKRTLLSRILCHFCEQKLSKPN